MKGQQREEGGAGEEESRRDEGTGKRAKEVARAIGCWWQGNSNRNSADRRVGWKEACYGGWM
jgi:hypothetical protein